MKNKNDTGGPDRKGADSESGATEASSSATGMFERPLMPPRQPEFEDPNVFGPATEVGPSAPSAGERALPGEFTQRFRAITPNSPTTYPEVAKVASPSQAALPSSAPIAQKAAADAKAGEFTRIFMRVPEEADLAPPSAIAAGPVSAQAAENPKTAGNATGPETGEFTRMMRATGSETKVAPTAGAPVGPPVPGSTPVRGISAPGANDAVSGTAGITELFVTPSQRPGAAPAAGQSSPRSGKNALPSEPGWGSGSASFGEERSAGEFTQLFRALDTNREASGQTMGMETPPRGVGPQIPQAAKVPDAGGGEFTKLMQSLSPERQGGPATPPLSGTAPTTREWPEPTTVRSTSEAEDDSASFTRILLNSAAREEAARGAKPVADAPPPKGSAPAPPMAPMGGMPQPLKAPIQRAALFGQPPAAPAPPPPAVPSPAPVSRLQSYLPLLLIVNAFALAVLILLVILALHRH
jgi:hypothetical protein